MEQKVVLLGTSGCGKTCIFVRFTEELYQPGAATTNASFCKRSVKVHNKEVVINLWDTAGQERFHSISSLYFRGAQFGFIVFDLSDARTLKQSDFWYEKIKSMSLTETHLYLVGNKCDIQQRQVSREQAEQYAKEKALKYVEVSAKNNIGITELFEEIGNIALQQQVAGPLHEARPVDIQIEIPGGKKDQQKCC